MPMLEQQEVYVMANCPHNVVTSLYGRYLKTSPEVGVLNIPLILRIISHLAVEMRKHYLPEFSFHKFVATKPGATRRRYLKAYKQLLDGSSDLKKISKITAFVKNEKYFEPGKSPRMILGRDPRFNILYARFISRLESAFFSLPQVANACDFAECGAKFKALLKAWMFENDMSAYEGSQRQFHLNLEYLVYSQVVNADELVDLQTLFAVKMRKSCHTNNGVKFDFDFCRGSGDMDTGLGNGVLNYITTMYFIIMNTCSPECTLATCGCGYSDFVLKGDDSYGVLPRGCKPYNTYEQFGFKAKLVVRQDPKLTEFCSGHFIQLASGEYYYVQKLRKLLTGLQFCINDDFVKNGWIAHYYRSLGDMYAVLYQNIPVYHDIAKFLQTASSKLAINVNLVGESYGAFEAFSNFKHSVQKIDVCAQTMLDISMANEFTFSELTALRDYCTSSRLEFPPHFNKRCNIKSRTATLPDLSEDVCRRVDRKTLSPLMRNWRRTLVKLSQQPSKLCV